MTNVLRAHDDELVRSVIEPVLRRAGHGVRAVTDGNACVRLLGDSEHTVGVLVLDVAFRGAFVGEVIEAAQVRSAGEAQLATQDRPGYAAVAWAGGVPRVPHRERHRRGPLGLSPQDGGARGAVASLPRGGASAPRAARSARQARLHRRGAARADGAGRDAR